MQGLVIFAIALLALALQQDQTPRAPVTNACGLLKIDPWFNSLTAETS